MTWRAPDEATKGGDPSACSAKVDTSFARRTRARHKPRKTTRAAGRHELGIPLGRTQGEISSRGAATCPGHDAVHRTASQSRDPVAYRKMDPGSAAHDAATAARRAASQGTEPRLTFLHHR